MAVKLSHNGGNKDLKAAHQPIQDGREEVDALEFQAHPSLGQDHARLKNQLSLRKATTDKKSLLILRI